MEIRSAMNVLIKDRDRLTVRPSLCEISQFLRFVVPREQDRRKRNLIGTF